MSWKEVSKDKIDEIKDKYCKRCRYSSLLGATSKQYATQICCGYILKTGKRRGCSPIDCEKFTPIRRR